MIIDDSQTEVAIVENFLKTEGFETIWRGEAKKALRLVPEIKPNLILMDVVMPGMNGFQATRKLSKHKLTKHIPVIIISTKDQEMDITWAKKQGAKDYFTKPISNDLGRFISSIRKYIL